MSFMQSLVRNGNVSWLSFDANGQSSYDLVSLHEPTTQKLADTVEKLESIPQVYLCARGDSFQTEDQHEKFFQEDLAKLFIVGAKARSNLSQPNERTRYYENVTERHDNDLKQELKSLMDECNKVIREKPQEHNVAGEISEDCIDCILGQSQKQLRRWKMFFLSFLHNNGSPSDIKQSSPFLSLAYGPKKISIAKNFALRKCRHGRGIIFIYSVNTAWPYYLLAKDLTAQLRRFGVRWYKDSNCELLLINGMYPHFLISVFEVSESERLLRFVLNPWIYKRFMEGKFERRSQEFAEIIEVEFDHTDGVRIDQINFHKFAKELGYQRWFFHEMGAHLEGVSGLDEFEPKNVYKP